MVNATSPTANFNRVEVRGAFVGWDGSPVTGSITFIPRAARAVDVAALKTIIRRPIVATLSGSSGTFSALLPATDDPDINVTFTYAVTENFEGGESYDILVPISAEATGIDLASIARTYPVDEASGSFPGAVSDATTTIKGVVELATNAETITGTDTVRVTTPAGVAAALAAAVPATPGAASTTVAGIVELATNTETTTGTDTARAVTPAGLTARLSGFSAAANIYVWYGPGGVYPALPATKPAGIVRVEASGPSQPSSAPSWVGSNVTSGQVPMYYTLDSALV